jgi:hypothetical protein
LFESLQSSELEWQRVARLEWSYASALDFEGRLTTLHRLMSEDPAFFVELISRYSEEATNPATKMRRFLRRPSASPRTHIECSPTGDGLPG